MPQNWANSNNKKYVTIVSPLNIVAQALSEYGNSIQKIRCYTVYAYLRPHKWIYCTPCVQSDCFHSIILLVQSVLYFVHSSKASAANYSMLLKLLLENVVLNIIWHQLGKIFPVENSEEENSATDYTGSLGFARFPHTVYSQSSA